MNHCCLAVLATGVCAVLSACASVPPSDGQFPDPSFVISGVVIRNDLPYPVTDVLIEVPATGAFAGCGNVLPRSECSNSFQHVDYRANAVIVSWKEHGQPHQTGEFAIELPDGASPGDEFLVEVIVFSPGQAGARLRDVIQKEFRKR